MAKHRQAAAQHLVDFADLLGDHHLITVAAGPDLEPVILSLLQAPDYRIEKAHASFPKLRAASPNKYRVHFRADEEWYHLDLAPTTENYHAIQPLPHGKWLLVRGRASGGTDRNTHVYDSDGTPSVAFHTGDGIADVQSTERGRVWVSYFDEGVFGDNPLGQSGLVCFDQHGEHVFRLGDQPDSVLSSMADCYALNVCSDRETWLYFYTDFPLVRLIDGKVAGSWTMPVAGSHGFAVNEDRVLFGGSYDQKDILFLGRIDEPKFEEITPLERQGQPLRKFRAFGRRDRLFLANDESLYVLKVIDL